MGIVVFCGTAGVAALNRMGMLAASPGDAVQVRHSKLFVWRPIGAERVSAEVATSWWWFKPSRIDGRRWWAMSSPERAARILAQPAGTPQPLPDDLTTGASGADRRHTSVRAYWRSGWGLVLGDWRPFAAIVMGAVAAGLVGYLAAVGVVEAAWDYAVWSEEAPSEAARVGSVAAFYTWAGLAMVPVYIAHAAMTRRVLDRVAARSSRTGPPDDVAARSARRCAWWGFPLLVVTVALLPIGVGIVLLVWVSLVPVLGIAGYRSPLRALWAFRQDPTSRVVLSKVSLAFGVALAVVLFIGFFTMPAALGLPGPWGWAR